MQLVVTRIVTHTSDIKSFILEHPEGAYLPRFKAGAHLQVEVVGNDGQPGMRAYPISNAPLPGGNRQYELGVLRKHEGGGGSRFMHEAVRQGTLLKVNMPRNHFSLAEDARHHILLAGVTLLDALRAHGVEIASDCRAGVRGAFLTPVAGGAVDHCGSFLSEDDKRAGDLMCVCVSRARDAELQLGL